MEELPVEVLSMVFGHVPTKELYPTCFLLSSTCLKAVLDESAWRARCEQDLGVSQLAQDKASWFHNYRATNEAPDSCLQWDNEMPKKPHSFCWAREIGITFPSADLVVWPKTSESKQSFSSGVVAVEFIIEQCNEFTWGVGFIDECFDVGRRKFSHPHRKVCYTWCNKKFSTHTVTGSGTGFALQREPLEGWKAGDVLGALLDFDKRELQFFLNGKWNETLPIDPESKELWAMASMYSTGNAVRIRLSPWAPNLPSGSSKAAILHR
ncbi:hypothetical protein QOT17_014277 [Balamuthia mandrillaris]